MTASAGHLDEVDVLRGLAAITVVLSHYIPYWNRYLEEVAVVVPNVAGLHAVELFFVISGFVIFMTIERCDTVLDFAVLRFSRLYPAYWVSLLLVALLGAAAFGREIWLGGLLANLTMFQHFLGYVDFDNVYWSLAVELAFYVNTALIIALGLHRRPLPVIVGWLCAAAGWGFWMHLKQSVPMLEPLPAEPRDWLAMLFALDYAPFFCIGILFYLRKRQGPSRPIAILLTGAVLVEFVIRSWQGAAIATGIALVFGLALYGHLRFLVSRATLWLGAISYSLYLVHRNLGYDLLPRMHAWQLGPVTSIALMVTIALLLATALTYCVERPASALLRRKYRQWRTYRIASEP